MRIRAWLFAACALSFGLGTAHAQNYSTGAVDIYNTCNTGPDLPQTLPEAANVRRNTGLDQHRHEITLG